MKSLAAASLCLLAAVSAPSLAADPTAAQRIEALEARIKALEADMEAMRSRAVEADPAPVAEPLTGPESVAATPAEPAAAASANGNEFNPAISVVLNASYSSHSVSPDQYLRSGFPLVGEGAPSANGFSLGESEISLAASIDEKFYGQLTLAIGSEDGETELGVEEAYIDTTALPAGFTLRAGRFFSNIGYLNSHHAHTDKFFDRPLPYQALLGNQYGDDGVQLRWVAPTDLFLEVGGEILRGQNFPSGGAGHGGAGVKTLFAHAGGDVGEESSWLAGVSVLDSRSEGAEDGFVGDSLLWIADATWKWAPDGNFKDGGVTLRGEYLVEDRNGDFRDPLDPSLDQPWIGERRGAYAEAVFRINRRWETGYRHDRLWADSTGPAASDFDPWRHSVMLSWLNSEFSLLRLQLSHDQSTETEADNAVTLQYQINMGAHGAHKF